MKALVERGMKAGAWGMSTGLIYLPGRYAETAELIALCEGRRPARRDLRQPHPQRGRRACSTSIDEALHDRPARRAAGPHLAPEGVGQGELGHWPTRPARGSTRPARRGRPSPPTSTPTSPRARQLAAMVVPHWASARGRGGLQPRLPTTRSRGRSSAARSRRRSNGRDGGAIDPDRPYAASPTGSAATWSRSPARRRRRRSTSSSTSSGTAGARRSASA